jgi:hypothetical protein
MTLAGNADLDTVCRAPEKSELTRLVASLPMCYLPRRIPYLILRPFISWLRRKFPRHVTTTEQVGRAMIGVAKHGAPKRVLESEDINRWSMS